MEKSRKQQILKNKLIPIINGVELDNIPAYRAVIYDRDDKEILTIQQLIKGEWFDTCGSWNLDTLIKLHLKNELSDIILIDAGQDWGAKGMRNLINDYLIWE